MYWLRLLGTCLLTLVALDAVFVALANFGLWIAAGVFIVACVMLIVWIERAVSR